jgi:hypothetical protein
MVLQNYMDFLKVVPDTCSETDATSDDADVITSVKVEEVTDIQAEEDPVPISCLVIKGKHEVS